MSTSKNIFILIVRNLIISLFVVSITMAAIIILSHKIERISDSVALDHHLEAQLKQRIELFEVLRHDAEIVGTNDVLIENAFVSSNNILGFIRELDTLAQKKSLNHVYHFDTPESSSISAPFLISTAAYSNNFTTNISNFSDYMKEFEKLPYFSKIEGLNITSQDERGWLGPSTISFRAILYTKTTQ